MGTRLRTALRDTLRGWHEDIEPRWHDLVAGVEPAFESVDAGLALAPWEPIFPARRGKSFPGAPAGAHMLRAFDGLPPERVRCVILGQDPYPCPAFATGRAFEAGNVARWRELDKMFSPSVRAVVQLVVAARTGEARYAGGVGDWPALLARRDAARAEGRLAGIGIATCLEPGGGNNIFEQLLNERLEVTTFVESCLLRVDPHGGIAAAMSTTSAGQGHETLVATVVGEELERDPDGIRVVHADSLEALPTRSPVASRMAIVLGSAAAKAARRIRARMARIAAHDLGEAPERVEYQSGAFFVVGQPERKLGFEEVAGIAHRQLHRMPPGEEPGLQEMEVLQVPGATGQLPDERREIQLYPCFSFQAHVPFVEIDPGTGKVEVTDYAIAHDCGTVINPDIVRGMIVGGTAHGIGAALYEKFAYDEAGQFLSGSFVDYLLPSALEVPMVRDVEHCTPSPKTALGQKGSGEGGYLGAPAAIASAVNDALAPLGVSLTELPMRMADVEAAIHESRAAGRTPIEGTSR